MLLIIYYGFYNSENIYQISMQITLFCQDDHMKIEYILLVIDNEVDLDICVITLPKDQSDLILKSLYEKLDIFQRLLSLI
jgi:hypothetical protein